MKKVFTMTAIFATVVIALGALWFGIFSTLSHFSGHELTTYNRFHKTVDDVREFNYWGILSPIQGESQKVYSDTITFSHKVIYPIAPKFDCVSPETSSEALVAGEIARVIADSLANIDFNLMFDYDGQAIAVRNAQGIKSPAVSSRQIFLSLAGTASPEAAKYGFWQSIQPGAYETENAVLAEQRLERTKTLLLSDLESRGIQVNLLKTQSREVQFTELENFSDTANIYQLLDSMRYVYARVRVPVQKVIVTPMTAPISAPLAVLLFSLLGLLLMHLFKKNSDVQEEKIVDVRPIQAVDTPEISEKGIDWWNVLYAIMILAGLVGGYYLLKYFWKIILIAAITIAFVYCLYRTLKPLYELYQESDLRDWFTEKRSYWATKPWTCKFVALWFIVTFLLGIFALATYLLGYWHICF